MKILRKGAAACVRVLSRRAAWSYVAGPRLEDALAPCAALSRRGMATTLGYWNRAGDEPRAIAAECLRMVESIAAGGLDSAMALKVSPLRGDRGAFERIVAAAKERGVSLICDAMRPEAADSTLRLASEAGIGAALPARWRRSLDDADRAVEMRMPVRVVKGEWPDPRDDRDIAERFIALVERLAGRAARVGVATHDPQLARAALARLRAGGTPCELELLYGLPLRRCIGVAHEAGVAVRIYVPYGEPWLPYAFADARSDPGIALRAARDLVLGRSLRLSWP